MFLRATVSHDGLPGDQQPAPAYAQDRAYLDQYRLKIQQPFKRFVKNRIDPKLDHGIYSYVRSFASQQSR
jgi:hypothetical protein